MDGYVWFVNREEDEVQRAFVIGGDIYITKDNESDFYFVDEDNCVCYPYSENSYLCFNSETEANKLLQAYYALSNSMKRYIELCNYSKWISNNRINCNANKDVFKRIISHDAINKSLDNAIDNKIINLDKEYYRTAWYDDICKIRITHIFVKESDLKSEEKEINAYIDQDLNNCILADKKYIFYNESEAKEFISQFCEMSTLMQNMYDKNAMYNKPDSDLYDMFTEIVNVSVG